MTMKTTIALMSAFAHARINEKIESEIISLWDLPFDKPLPDPTDNFPETTDNLPENIGNISEIPEPIETPNQVINDEIPQFVGNCVACITAGGIFCMDGNDENLMHTAQEYGSCH